MSTFFLLVEVFSYVFALYLFIEKKDLAIIYIPILIFSNTLIEPVFPAFMYYGTISFLILSCIIKNGFFFRNNIFAVLLFLYFLVLMTRSGDLTVIRPLVFPVLWLFISIPLISEVYQKYTQDVIFKEIANAALIVLILFIANVLAATKMRYAPTAMYGITNGILYGNMYAAGFNILAIAVFITVLKLTIDKKIIHFIVIIVSLAFILLSMRRSVMLVSTMGVAIALLTLLTQNAAKKFIVFGGLIMLMGYIIYSSTDFMNEFKERYELRGLEDRALEGEGRFMEYGFLYKDMFVDEKYSPWIGYELFNSAGHYGNGVFGTRTLHSDVTSILHSSGILGLALYLLMAFTAFLQSFKAAVTKTDKFIVFFCAAAFAVFTGTGRFTECGFMLLIYLILMLPLAKSNTNSDYFLSLDNAD